MIPRITIGLVIVILIALVLGRKYPGLTGWVPI